VRDPAVGAELETLREAIPRATGVDSNFTVHLLDLGPAAIQAKSPSSLAGYPRILFTEPTSKGVSQHLERKRPAPMHDLSAFP